jgi:cytochrome c-type biogenesis protein
MEVGIGTLGLSLLAGALSTLSPCVLPLLPIVVGAALASHRRGPLALAAGLAVSFTVAGVVLGSVGLYFGLDQRWLRKSGAVMLLIFGVILLSNVLQRRLAGAMTGISSVGNSLAARIPTEGLGGQFTLGLLLGLVWAPCVGPTLGVAATLASQSEALLQVTLVMLIFGIYTLGTILLVVGVSILTGLDKRIEAVLVAHSPVWLTDLTTRY